MFSCLIRALQEVHETSKRSLSTALYLGDGDGKTPYHGGADAIAVKSFRGTLLCSHATTLNRCSTGSRNSVTTCAPGSFSQIVLNGSERCIRAGFARRRLGTPTDGLCSHPHPRAPPRASTSNCTRRAPCASCFDNLYPPSSRSPSTNTSSAPSATSEQSLCPSLERVRISATVVVAAVSSPSWEICITMTRFCDMCEKLVSRALIGSSFSRPRAKPLPNTSLVLHLSRF